MTSHLEEMTSYLDVFYPLRQAVRVIQEVRGRFAMGYASQCLCAAFLTLSQEEVIESLAFVASSGRRGVRQRGSAVSDREGVRCQTERGCGVRQRGNAVSDREGVRCRTERECGVRQRGSVARV